MPLNPETKKTLLYGGGAVASIVALVLFVRSRQSAQAAQGFATSPGGGVSPSGGGVPSNAQSAAEINAATALAVEQSRATTAYQTATLQTNAAIQIAQIQGNTAKAAQTGQTLRSLFGAGGAGTAAVQPGGIATTATKGLFDLIKSLFTPSEDTTNTAILPETKFPPSEGYFPNANPALNVISPGEVYGPSPNEFGPIPAASYDAGGVMVASPGPFADYYQGSSGSGDSSWFGDSTFNYGDIGGATSESGGGITE